MDLEISGKHALVGGGSKGLGLACAKALADEGCMVTLVSRSMDHLASALNAFHAEAQVHLVEADLSTSSGRASCIDQVKENAPVDILINNTGGPPPGGTHAHTDAVWRNTCDQLLLYVKDFCEAFVPGMVERKWGRVITITSLTVREPAPNLVLSNVFRSAVTSYLKILAGEVAEQGVTVNTVMPGAYRTDRYEEILDALSASSEKDKETLAAEIASRSPQNRFQDPEEFAQVVAFLASTRSSAITGANLPVEGGMLSGLF